MSPELTRRAVLAAPMALAGCAQGGISGVCTPKASGGVAMVPSGAQWLVPVTIDGRDVSMVLDTGAGATVLTRAAVSGAGNAATIGRFVFAGKESRDVKLPVLDLNLPQGSARPVAGVLGLPDLRGSDLELDFAGQMLRLYERPTCGEPRPDWDGNFTEVRLELLQAHAAGPAAVPVLVGDAQGLLATVAVNGRAFTALLDTGAERTTLNADAATLSGLPIAGNTIMTADASGKILAVTRITGNSVRVGTMTWSDVAMNVTPARYALGVDMLLGQDLMRGRRIWAMLGAKKLFLQRG